VPFGNLGRVRKIDYIVRVADHKTAESAPGVITLEPHIHQLLGKYAIIRQRILDSVNPHCTTSLTGLVYIGGSIVPFGNLGRVRYIPR
jgi:hypothetical protein